nr:transposase [Roseobacter sp. H9]
MCPFPPSSSLPKCSFHRLLGKELPNDSKDRWPGSLTGSLLREFGHILPIGIEAVTAFAKRHLAGDHPKMPEIANGMLGMQCYQFIGLNERIDGCCKMIEQHAMLSFDARRLMRMPGIGPITASAVVATIGDAHQFRKGRDLAAWLGLPPLNKSSGGKERLGKITKKGDRYIRKLLVVSMTSRAVMAKRSSEKADLWAAIDHRGQTIPVGSNSDVQQGSQDHLGDAHKETGIPGASVLTTRTAEK